MTSRAKRFTLLFFFSLLLSDWAEWRVAASEKGQWWADRPRGTWKNADRNQDGDADAQRFVDQRRSVQGIRTLPGKSQRESTPYCQFQHFPADCQFVLPSLSEFLWGFDCVWCAFTNVSMVVSASMGFSYYNVLSLTLTGFTRFYRVLLSFYWVLLGFIEFCQVELGFTEFYWVLLGFTRFYWVSVGFDGFYWVLLSSTRLNWVLLGFTGFYWFFIGFY